MSSVGAAQDSIKGWRVRMTMPSDAVEGRWNDNLNGNNGHSAPSVGTWWGEGKIMEMTTDYKQHYATLSNLCTKSIRRYTLGFTIFSDFSRNVAGTRWWSTTGFITSSTCHWITNTIHAVALLMRLHILLDIVDSALHVIRRVIWWLNCTKSNLKLYLLCSHSIGLGLHMRSTNIPMLVWQAVNLFIV